jgi:hypothetical protein
MFQGINLETFYKAFDEVLGKSIMFIVRKNRHEPNYVGTTYDVMRVADSGSIIEYFKEKGVSIVPSKVVWIVMHLFLFLFLLLSYLIC